MTKAQLIKALEHYPDNMDVMIRQINWEVTLGEINTVRKEKVKFSGAGISKKEEPKITCIILDEE